MERRAKCDSLIGSVNRVKEMQICDRICDRDVSVRVCGRISDRI